MRCTQCWAPADNTTHQTLASTTTTHAHSTALAHSRFVKFVLCLRTRSKGKHTALRQSDTHIRRLHDTTWCAPTGTDTTVQPLAKCNTATQRHTEEHVQPAA